jgi:hypothetical protein
MLEIGDDIYICKGPNFGCYGRVSGFQGSYVQIELDGFPSKITIPVLIFDIKKNDISILDITL